MENVATETPMTSRSTSSEADHGPAPLTLTPAACQAIKTAMAEQKLDKLRVGVIPGGCSGMSYDLELVNEVRAGDLTHEMDGVTVIVDPMSAQYLKGVSIDFVTTVQGSGFKFSNPNAQSTCGCGSSFSA
jgi:iron-sulfur cluster assembly protein